MKDPYKVLGVSPKADDEEIRRVYHELARKYHPDRYTNSDLADLASEKMKEVNAAYEEIQRMRAEGEADSHSHSDSYGAGAGGYQQGGGAQGDYSYETSGAGNYKSRSYSAEAREKFIIIRNCINAGNIYEAERLISEIDDADRGAEWHFLMGCIQLRKGFYMDAQFSFDTAYRLEPTNNEYWQFKERMNERARGYGGYRTGGQGSSCCDCDTCTTLCVMDACCECMGGDLVPCC